MDYALAVVLKALATQLHARVELRVNFEFKLQNEVAVILVRAQKSVRSTALRCAYNSAVAHRVIGFAVDAAPPV